MGSGTFRRHGRTGRREGRGVRSRLACGLAVVALAATGCASKGGSGSGGLTGAQPGTSVSVTSGPATTLPTSTPTPTPTSTSGAGITGTSDPKIVTFKVKRKPACAVIATSDAPFAVDPVNIILEWKVSGATGIALSLDNPDFFKTYHTGSLDNYGTSGTVELPFNCDPTVQPNTTHKYTLDTLGPGKTQQQTLTVTVQTSP